ncbi:MAG: type II toxin-antitoxin system VapC family toxin [Candidatus Cybelea sp.]
MIVDASALVASLGNPKSERLLFGEGLAAPDLLIPETLNAFWKLQRAGRSIPALSILLSTLDHVRIVPSRPHAARAAELADRLDHPVYDCLYLALAEAEGDVLLTADAAFERKTRVPGLRKRVRLMPA